MANRRMFSKDVLYSEAFLDLPKSAQTLYFYLCIEADDYGFLSGTKRILRMVQASDEDLGELQECGLVIIFKSGVLVIRDWRINNYVQPDRRTETRYITERSMIINWEYSGGDEKGKSGTGKAYKVKREYKEFVVLPSDEEIVAQLLTDQPTKEVTPKGIPPTNTYQNNRPKTSGVINLRNEDDEDECNRLLKRLVHDTSDKLKAN